MNIPEGFVLVPVELTAEMREAFHESYESYEDGMGECPDSQWEAMLMEALPPELPAYDEAAELAACRAHWEKNPNCLFSDMWLGWKACAQSRDGSVSDE